MSYVARNKWQGSNVRSHWRLMRDGVMPFNKFWLAYFGVVMALGFMLAGLAYWACSDINPLTGLTGCGITGVWGSVELCLFTSFAFASPGVAFGLFSTPEDVLGNPVDLGITGPSAWVIPTGNQVNGRDTGFAVIRARVGDYCPACRNLIVNDSPTCYSCNAGLLFKSGK
jgi:hypothetical protein